MISLQLVKPGMAIQMMILETSDEVYEKSFASEGD